MNEEQHIPEIKYEDIPRWEQDYRIELEYPDSFTLSLIGYHGSSTIDSGEISKIDSFTLGEAIKEEILRLSEEFKENEEEKIKKIENIIKVVSAYRKKFYDKIIKERKGLELE